MTIIVPFIARIASQKMELSYLTLCPAFAKSAKAGLI
jgi:hypothetical protein|tara:strand:- start:1493 stop:1603 length:111 start_codon:yes stop_codon:yes gene_type:complete